MATQPGGLVGGLTSQPSGSASLGWKKDGTPSAKFWENPDTVAELEGVRLWIGKHYKKVPLNVRSGHFRLKAN